MPFVGDNQAEVIDKNHQYSLYYLLFELTVFYLHILPPSIIIFGNLAPLQYIVL
jgi:hypothetical protein